MSRSNSLASNLSASSDASDLPLDPASYSLDVRKDIQAILSGMRLGSVRRYFHQRYWDKETQAAEFASRIESMPRLESVAEHSWHVADIVLLLIDRYPELDLSKCLAMALMHDKMELFTGDFNPVGKDGSGQATHAFSPVGRARKEMRERNAIQKYLSRLRDGSRDAQGQILYEALEGRTAEARFVLALDKLQALAFVYMKKRGNMELRHLAFTLRYSRKVIEYFPELRHHYGYLRARLLLRVARQRGAPLGSLAPLVHQVESQPTLF